MSEIAELESLLNFWDWFSYLALALVFIGVVGESIADLTNLIKSPRWKSKTEKISALLLITGLAGELVSSSKLSELNGRIVAILNKQAAEAQKAAGEANERAGSAEQRAAEANEKAEQEKLARVKIEQKVAPRRLTKEQQERIARKLKPFAGQRINVLIYRGDVEAWFIADQIKVALGGITGAGWIVHSATVTEFNRAFSGMMVETTVKANDDSLIAAKLLIAVLSAEHLVVGGPSAALKELRAEAFGDLDSEANIQLVVGN